MGRFVEGQIYDNPKTGQKLLRKNGGWVSAPKIASDVRPTKIVGTGAGDGTPAWLNVQYAPGDALRPDTGDSGPMSPDSGAGLPRGPDASPKMERPIERDTGVSTRIEPQSAVNPAYSKKLNEWSGKNDAEFRVTSRDAATAATKLLPNLDDLDNLIERAPVGPYAPIAKAWGAVVPDGWYGSESDDDFASIRSKVISTIIPLAKNLKPVSNFDMESLEKTIGDPNTPKKAFHEAVKMYRREARAAVFHDNVLQQWIKDNGGPNETDARGRTFTQAFAEWYNDPRTIKQLEAPGARVKPKDAPKAGPVRLFRDRNGKLQAQ